MGPRVRTLLVGLSVVACATALVIAGVRSPLSAGGEPPDECLGKQVGKLDLKDTTGKLWSVKDLQGHKAVVVLFLGTECPINNAYLPRLAELHKDFAANGVLVLAVNSNKQDTPEN